MSLRLLLASISRNLRSSTAFPRPPVICEKILWCLSTKPLKFSSFHPVSIGLIAFLLGLWPRLKPCLKRLGYKLNLSTSKLCKRFLLSLNLAEHFKDWLAKFTSFWTTATMFALFLDTILYAFIWSSIVRLHFSSA